MSTQFNKCEIPKMMIVTESFLDTTQGLTTKIPQSSIEDIIKEIDKTEFVRMSEIDNRSYDGVCFNYFELHIDQDDYTLVINVRADYFIQNETVMNINYSIDDFTFYAYGELSSIDQVQYNQIERAVELNCL